MLITDLDFWSVVISAALSFSRSTAARVANAQAARAREEPLPRCILFRREC
jgi:hypothetical protein